MRLGVGVPLSWDRMPREVVVALCEIRRREYLDMAADIVGEKVDADMMWQYSPNLEESRNIICETIVKNGYDYLLFIDGDTVPAWDVIPRLLQHKLPVVSGLYFRKAFPYAPVSCNYKDFGNSQELEFINVITDEVDEIGLPKLKTGLVESEVIGMGCAMISCEALKKIGYPYFNYTLNKNVGYNLVSEDIHFCNRAKEEGIEIYTDIDCQCVHIGTQHITANAARVSQIGAQE